MVAADSVLAASAPATAPADFESIVERLVIAGSDGDDPVVLSSDAVAGYMAVTGAHVVHGAPIADPTALFRFRTPTGAIVVNLGLGNDSANILGFGDGFAGSVEVYGDSGVDTLSIAVADPTSPSGLPADVTWFVAGPGAGSAGQLRFGGFENLAGGADNEDTFVVLPGGSLEGTFDGGPGGYDSLDARGPYQTAHLIPSGPDSGSRRSRWHATDLRRAGTGPRHCC